MPTQCRILLVTIGWASRGPNRHSLPKKLKNHWTKMLTSRRASNFALEVESNQLVNG